MSIPTTSSRTGAQLVLAARGIGVSYGGIKALQNVDVEVGAGQLVGLIGPNGAGKTTFVDAIGGFVGSTGRVMLDGEDLSSLAPHRRARKGLSRTWQSIELFDDLSVEKNLVVAQHHPSAIDTLREMVAGPRDAPETMQALSLVGLEWAAELMPDALSLGQRKLVGVARALVARSRLVCLDEPAAGLDRAESVELGRRLRGLADAGQSMLLIDHDMGLVLSICDHVVVLNFGEVIAAGPPRAVARDPNVVAAYLGDSADAAELEVPDSDARPNA